MANYQFYNRDLSWLSFNGRVMEEAANDKVPLLERIKFLSIFSSNLDEFYRVRMPVLHAFEKLGNDANDVLQQAKDTINHQQNRFGQILREQLLPLLGERNIHLIYNVPFPPVVEKAAKEYFLSEVLAFLQPAQLNNGSSFFPGNNKLYLVVNTVDVSGTEDLYLLNVPSDELPRFFTVKDDGKTFIVLLDDIVRYNLDRVFKGKTIRGCYSIKVTRDAELDLKDEYGGDLSEEIETQLRKRDMGLATRFLYDADMPLRTLQTVIQKLALQDTIMTIGGHYHNLKDLFSLPVSLPGMAYDAWPAVNLPGMDTGGDMQSVIRKKDILINTPYQNYGAVLRFFNEAAVNPDVKEIYITLYRVAANSRIVNALISAAKNGKAVQVMVELKARFDEANNLKWAKRMKDAGVKIVYSVTALKVHAKVALVKTQIGNRMVYTGLLATGNFNESTAKFYTDHVLFTADHGLLREVELLFIFLAKRKRPQAFEPIAFERLLVAGFNLQQRFVELIDREIGNARNGLPAGITIKMNNLEEQVLISKLYEASQAGVKISLIIRSICCLMPGVKGMSENIKVHRIVDRYLEHGRIFIFHNKGDEEVWLGSADWMNRNIYRRVEVCFPILDKEIKKQLKAIVDLLLRDNIQAVQLDENLQNVKIKTTDPAIHAQQEIYKMLSSEYR
ncbi:polyphosphate kinase 1 [Mucilaginibacter sp.]|jgi:polyphosphate kinase|uniref:polyphosphate kinase 1 n=1 Tax=Mucilaginibacter sp. TaxID=1882438 RepID=UPI002C2AD4CD|nr:polyphosphate kinase 1 [Mucilaginibacter sp.]HTI58906.1 polyphosphate kinase 1 [Mucilaginibacter sp.]